jgi:hypothetical protein
LRLSNEPCCGRRWRTSRAWSAGSGLAAEDAAGNIHTSICSLTKPLRNAAADLALLAGEGVPGLSGTVRGSLRFFERTRLEDSITVVLERPDGERLFEIERGRFDYFEMYPVPPGPYRLSVHLNDDNRALHSKVILVAPGQCPRERVDLTVGTFEDWSNRDGSRNRYRGVSAR